MALIDEVKAVCDRLAPLGWRGLLKSASGDALDIEQKTPEALQKVLMAQLSRVDRAMPGFEDFDSAGDKGITAGKPSQSLLYHAFASPGVVRDAKSALLKGFPTLAEIETVENFVFGIQPPTLDSLVKQWGGAKLSIVVYATEYRPCPDTAEGAQAELTFSRTGIARIGTSRPKWYADVRGYWPEDEDNPHGFRVIPVRFTAWLAAPTKGPLARVMRVQADAAKDDKEKTFWVPVHKLFDGPECLDGLNLTLECSARFFNMKLQRVMKSLKPNPPNGYPYVIEDGLAELQEQSEFGRIAVVPVVQEALVRRAIVNGKPLTFRVPEGRADDEGFATYETPSRPLDENTEIHHYPAYVHARTRVTSQDGTFSFEDLNDEKNVGAVVMKGGYEALLHIDMTGEGWVDVKVPQLASERRVENKSRAAYVLLSAPDFFPSCGQRELSRWSRSKAVPASFGDDQLWGVPPVALSETRRPANLQLPGNRFDPKEDTMTAVIGMGRSADRGTAAPVPAKQPDAARASTLPDDGAGAFAPGWDVAIDVKGTGKDRVAHLAAYGLGSPFPEDAKLCAALSTYWPAVAPDVYRSMSMHTGNADYRGTVAPLTDEEIGQTGSLPWDGVSGPKIVQMDGKPFVEMASFLHVDYVTNAVENRFSNRLTSRINAVEYEHRVLAAARVHWVLSGGTNVKIERTRWLFLSFRPVSPGDRELLAAQDQASHVLDGTIYRVETCFIGNRDRSMASPKGPRFRLVPLVQRNFFFVSAEDSIALRRREEDPQWGRAAAE
jgi:hypothetical protein